MSKSTKIIATKNDDLDAEKEPPQIYQLHAENALIRFERYRRSKTVCLQVTSCPHRAILKNIPKVSTQVYTVQHLRSRKTVWSGMAKIISRAPIQHIRVIQFKPVTEVSSKPKNSITRAAGAPTSILTSPSTIRIHLPKNDELATIEFNISLKLP